MKKEEIPKLHLQLADGTPLKIISCASTKISIGKMQVEHTFLIADISDSGIIGLDFLKNHSCQIDLRTEDIIIMGNRVACTTEESNLRIRRVTFESRNHNTWLNKETN